MCNTPVEVQFTSAGCLNYPCLLRGEPLELVAREANVSIARLTERALAGAATGLKERRR
jgi:hypothetical protein